MIRVRPNTAANVRPSVTVGRGPQGEPGPGNSNADVATYVTADGPTKDALSTTYVGRRKSVKTKAQAVEIWGHSFAFGIAATDRSKTFGYILAHMLGLPERNEAVSGASITSAPSGGSYVKTLQFVKPTGLGAVDGSGAIASGDRGFTSPDGVYVAMYGINDLNELGGLANELEAFRDAYRTVLSRWRAGVVFENDDPSFTFNGTWSTHTVTDRNSGSAYRYAVAPDRSYSITTPADFPGGTVAIGINSAAPVGGGATHTATVNGRTYVFDAHQRRTGGTGYVHTFRIPDVEAGVQTINVALSDVVTLTGVDYWQWEAPTEQAPLVVLLQHPYAVDYSIYGAGGTFGPPTDARVDELNQVIAEVAAEFDERVLVVDLHGAMDRNAAMHSPDKLHPNDVGFRHMAEVTAAAIGAAGWTILAGGKDEPYQKWGTAPPTGNRQGWYVGDVILNSAPAVLGTAGSQYVIHSWVCTVAGRPGTWVERRMLTGT